MSAPADPYRDEFAETKRLANGRWGEILPALLGWPAETCDGRNRPCPGCGGRNRFRFTNYNGDGSVLCNQCAPDGIGDGFDAVAAFGCVELAEARRLVADYLNAAKPTKRKRKPFLALLKPAKVGGADDPERARRRAEAPAAVAKFQSQMTAERLAALERDTGVSAGAWQSLGVGYCDGDDLVTFSVSGEEAWLRLDPSEAWAIPEMDATETIVGFSCRAIGGAKGCPAGGSRGLVISPTWGEASDERLIVEGGSDVASCLAMGIAAAGRSSNTAGVAELSTLLANSPTDSFLIVGENDAGERANGHEWPGRFGAKRTAERLSKALDAPVRFAMMPDGAKDVRDWLRKRGPGSGPELLALLRSRAETVDERTGPRAIARRYSEIEAKPVDWLWPERIALGSLTLFVGTPGSGKSYLMCDLAARVSTGSRFIDGAPCRRGSAVLMNFEDSPEYSTAARLAAHEADPAKIIDLTEIADSNGSRRQIRPDDVRLVEREIRRLGDCRALIIDPIGDYLGPDVNAHRDSEVRAVLGPLADLAESTGIAVVCVMHNRKSGGATADETALGSVGFVGKARGVQHVQEDRTDDSGRRYLSAGKSNLGRKAPTLAFTIGGDPPRVQWEAEPVDLTADAIMERNAERLRPGKPQTKQERAVDWLRNELADGEVSSSEIKRRSEIAGIAWKTLDRASQVLNVEKSPSDFGGVWVWRLSDEQQTPPPSASGNDMANSGETGGDCSGNGNASQRSA